MALPTSLGTPPLVGRRQLLRDLTEAVPSGSSPGTLRLLRGDPGIGKTRLLHELAATHRAAGGVALIGRSWGEGDAPPYWPWTQALRGLPGGDRATRLHDLVDCDDTSDRFELFDAVAAQIAEATAKAPLIVGLDDIHDADVGTLLLLRFLAQDLDRLPVLLVAAYRPAEALQLDRVAPHVAALERDGPAVDLLPLSADEVGQLIGDPDLASEVQAQTGGNPLFVLHVLRRLSNPAITEVSGDVRSAVRSTICTVDPPVQRTLAVVALLGPAATSRRVADVLREPVDTVTRRLHRAVDAGLLGVDDDLAWRTTHPIVAEVLVQDLGDDDRVQLHVAAAEAIGDDPEHASERADHLLAAGVGHERAAYAACRIAARAAARNLAHEEAADYLVRARDLLALFDGHDLPAPDRVERCNLNLEIGRAMWRACRRDEADQAFEAATAIARELDDPVLLAHTALGGGYESPTSGEARIRRAERLEQALVVQPPDDHALRARLLAQIVTNEDGAVAASGLRARADEALAMARRVDDPAAVGYALVARQVVDLGPASLAFRLSASREIISLGERCGDAALVLQGRFHLIGALLEFGDLGAMNAEMPAHERGIDQVAEPAYARHALWFRCMRMIVAGRADEAEVAATEAFEVAVAASDPDAALVYGGQLSVIRWLQGRTAEMEQLWVDLRHQEPDRVIWTAIVAWYWATSGQVDGARGALEQVQDLDRVADDRHWLLAMVTLAEAAAVVGDLNLVRELRSRLLPYGDRAVPISAGIAWWGPVARPLGLLAVALGLDAEAERHFARAIELAARAGAMPWVAHAQLDLAAFRIARGTAGDDTRRMAEEARRTIERWGPLEHRTRAIELTERLGPALRPATTTSIAPPHASGTTGVGPPTPIAQRPKVSVMGAFEVVTPTGTVARWTSRKARELLKILVARRGLPVPREQLMEMLWPGEPPERLGNRLSVAISTIRRALDARSAGPENDPIVADWATIRLRLDRVDVDVERFLASANEAVRLHLQSNDPRDVRVHEALQEAFDIYGGETLADEPYTHWAELLRAEVRSAIVAVSHALAETAEAWGDMLVAVRAHHRVLDVDRFDETAHRGLVRTFTALEAHGQARAAEADHQAALAELWASSDAAPGT